MLLRLGAPPERVGRQRVRGLLSRAEPARRYVVDAGSEWRQRCSSLRQQHINVSHCARKPGGSRAARAHARRVGLAWDRSRRQDRGLHVARPGRHELTGEITSDLSSFRSLGAHAISARAVPAAANHAHGTEAALSVAAAAAPTRPARPDRRPRRALPGEPTGCCCVAYPHRMVCSGGRRSFGRHLPREDAL